MKRLTPLLLLIFSMLSHSQTKIDLDYYLPQDVSYDKAIPTPKSSIGFEVGEWHVSHDKLVQYMYALASASDRISIENRGSTFEGRPLVLLTITSPENHRNIEQIRSEHLSLTNPQLSSKLTIASMPLVVYQGFSIHGNEASGANAGLLLAYYLAAAKSDFVDKLLSNTVILLDPSYNPDGLQRFSTWVNMHKNMNMTANNYDREYREAWPGGRTNHYWFDLNRDWLVGQLPESQARIASFHKWKPNILTDHHEMGTNATFFFQPGIPSRTHPLTPDMNQKLTAKIGEYHARALNNIGSLYYTEESFDDYYYGKGSTFPDINGSIGILFEQASARGHQQNSDNGLLTFPFAIRNQFTTALSTLKAATELKNELLNYQRDFYKNAAKESARDKNKAIVFGDSNDKVKLYHFLKILKRQQIEVHKLKSSITTPGKTFDIGSSYLIPNAQANSLMIKAMFEKRTSFKDSLFYDISAWTLPLAFNIDHAYVNHTGAMGPEVEELVSPQGEVSKKSSYAYLFKWNEYSTPNLLYQILSKGLRAKVAMKPFTLEDVKYSYGTIMVPVQNQQMNPDEIYITLQHLAKNTGVSVNGVNTGLTEGIDLGSTNFKTLKKPAIAVLIGDGISSYDAGEIWHLLDTRYDIPVTKIDVGHLNRVDLSSFTTILLPNSRGNSLQPSKETLKKYVENGGNLIAYRNSLKWLATNKFIKLNFAKAKPETKNVSFDKRSELRGAQVIGGAIFEAQIDRSHPVNFGFNQDKIALFRNTTVFVKPDSISNYKNPIQYTKNPLLSGYISKENLNALRETLPFKTARLGKGKVMVFTDNTNFRAFWYGTNKLMMNAIFFGNLM